MKELEKNSEIESIQFYWEYGYNQQVIEFIVNLLLNLEIYS